MSLSVVKSLQEGESKQTKEKLSLWSRFFLGGPVAKPPSSQFRGLGSIPSRGTRSHMPQLRVPVKQLQAPHVARKMDNPSSDNLDLVQSSK